MELTELEKRDRDVLDKFSVKFYELYNHLVLHKDFNNKNRLKVISGMIKPENNGEQFGYLHNTHTGILYTLIKRLNKNSLIDLGSGAGLLLACLKAYDTGLKLAGIEIEDELLAISNKLSVEAKKKDLLNLEDADINNFEIVYFWEPLH